jgi:hypothetical protein
MESEGPYFHRCGTPGEKSNCTACAYEEGRKSMEKEIEEKKAIKDTLLCGTGFVMEGKRVPPEDVYLSETEIKLQKVEKEFKELLSIAQELCDDLGDDIAEKFRDWKKARGIE